MAGNANGTLHKSTKPDAENTSSPLTVELAPVPPPSYACEPHECDVQDQLRLIEYRAKRQEWLRWYSLHKDVPNNIQQQIFSMLFMDLAYRSVTQPRQVGEQDADLAVRNGLLAHLLDQGYVASQVFAIRKLLDKRSDVISLRRLLNDIHNNRSLITREIYVSHNGVPYDPDLWKQLPQQVEYQIFGINAPGLSHYLASKHRHETFDLLAGINCSLRQRGDLIRDEVFKTLNNWLDTSPAAHFITLSHKFFAHAADMTSLGSLKYSGIKLDDVASTQRAIIRVERAITDEILFIGVAREVVPMPPLGLFQKLQFPYSLEESIPDMEKMWDLLTEERNQWRYGISKELSAAVAPEP
jgi:type IV secretory pathway TrbD component